MQELIREAEAMGLRVMLRDIGRSSGYLYAGGLVVINSTRSLLTQRVTLAHEMGHHALGHDWTRDHDVRRDELDADTWAARLLVTPDAYRAAEACVGCHPGALAKELGVTRQLVELRQRDFARDFRIIRTVEQWRNETWAS